MEILSPTTATRIPFSYSKHTNLVTQCLRAGYDMLWDDETAKSVLTDCMGKSIVGHAFHWASDGLDPLNSHRLRKSCQCHDLARVLIPAEDHALITGLPSLSFVAQFGQKHEIEVYITMALNDNSIVTFPSAYWSLNDDQVYPPYWLQNSEEFLGQYLKWQRNFIWKNRSK
jgi:hypothetical protein